MTSPIDTAIKNNQVAAVKSILKYIRQFQNNFVSSYLFLRNMPQLIEKEINLTELLDEDSKIFTIEFDFDDWPGNHYNDEECIRAYNGSYFDIRDKYREVFPEDNFDNSDESMALNADQPFKKIKYSVNLIAQISMFIEQPENPGPKNQHTIFNEEVSLMDLAS